MVAPILIFAIGNESRGDDALGPLLLRELDGWLNSGKREKEEGTSLREGAVEDTPKALFIKAGLPQPPASQDEANQWLSLGEGGREKEEGFAEQFELIEDFQLQIEHAMDMKDRQRVLFLDAGMDTPSPFSFYRLHGNSEPVLYSHALAPEALLKVYTQFYHEPPPDAFVLCIRGDFFELGEPLSGNACKNLALALTFTKQRLLETETPAWDSASSR
jgi:hypothetical protein